MRGGRGGPGKDARLLRRKGKRETEGSETQKEREKRIKLNSQGKDDSEEMKDKGK